MPRVLAARYGVKSCPANMAGGKAEAEKGAPDDPGEEPLLTLTTMPDKAAAAITATATVTRIVRSGELVRAIRRRGSGGSVGKPAQDQPEAAAATPAPATPAPATPGPATPGPATW